MMQWLVLYPEDGPSVAFYVRWVQAGDILPCVVSPSQPPVADLAPFAALLLTGGADVAPARYGATVVHPATYGVDALRDEVELQLAARFLAAGKPVFGICRGIQLLNVFFGGNLIQDIPDYLRGLPAGDATAEEHRRRGSYDAEHALHCAADTVLGQVLAAAHSVNSAHHQAVDPACLGRGLTVAARSPSGIIEAVETAGDGACAEAVQWHPERLPAAHPASCELRRHWRALAGG